jgi:formylglycine-generating enzyme required for sulfatase activity
MPAVVAPAPIERSTTSSGPPPEITIQVPDRGLEPADSRIEGRSPFGLLHAIGNAGEWVWNPWTTDLAGSLAELIPARSGARVVRGGSYRHAVDSCGCAWRNRAFEREFKDHFGFRCAKSVDPGVDR